MTIARIDLPDPIYQRAWSVADAAERATLLSSGNPRRGDIIYQIDTTVYYIVVESSIIQPLSGFAAIPIDLTTQVTGVLPTANGGTGVDIATVALLLGSGQIAFPATQNPSADSNTLDDYEEGTWTPGLVGTGGSGFAFSVSGGTYTKIGRQVMCNFQLTLSSLGTITGDIQLTDLPHLANNQSGVPFIMIHASLTTPWVQLYCIVKASTTNALLRGMRTAGTINVTNLNISDLAFDTTLAGGLIYTT